MSTFKPAYRLTVYGPRSVDPTEATILTPIAGAPHSDQFKVTTLATLAGWKPYLFLPEGRTGKIDVLSRTTDIGVVNVTLMDMRLSSADNLTRWLTAYFGSLKQEFRAGGLKAKLEESVDGGSTWSSWFTGRLQTVKTVGRTRFVLQIQDEASELRQSIFVGRPHSSITYAGVQSLAPVGLTQPYGTIPAVTPFTGVTGAHTLGGYTFPNSKQISLDASQWTRADLIVTSGLRGAVAPVTPLITGGSVGGPSYGSMPNFSGTARAVLKHTSGANNGLTGVYKVGQLGLGAWDKSGHVKLTGFYIEALETTEAGYLAVPADGVTVQGDIVAGDAMIDKEHPLLIDATSPTVLLNDILAGKFGYIWHSPETLPTGKNYGDVKRSFPVNSSNFTPFLNDTTYPPVRFVITEPAQMGKWIQENLLKPYSLAMFLDADGQVNLVDLRLPASLSGITTLTDADLVEASDQIDWTFDRSQAITRVDAKWYGEEIVKVEDLNRSPDKYPSLSGGLLNSIEHPLILLALGSGDFGDQTYQMDAPGYRAIDGEQYQGGDRASYLMSKLLEHMMSFRRPFAVGASTAAAKCRRTANVPRVPGGLFLLQFTMLPDPATNKRGGTRLVRAVQVGFNGVKIEPVFLDMGIAIVASAPTASQPAQEVSNTSVGVTTTVTLNASSQPAELRYAVTDTSVGSAPVDTDPAWRMAPLGTNPIIATGAVTFRPSTPGKRIWVQVRTMPTAGQAPQMPSAWVLAGGNGRVDLAAWPAPSALTKSNDTGRAFRLSWTNGATDLMVQVLIRSPVGDPPTLVDTLPPGSTQFDFQGVDPSTTYRCGVRYYDGRNVGPEVTADFTTGASSATAPALSSMTVLV